MTTIFKIESWNLKNTRFRFLSKRHMSAMNESWNMQFLQMLDRGHFFCGHPVHWSISELIHMQAATCTPQYPVSTVIGDFFFFFFLAGDKRAIGRTC